MILSYDNNIRGVLHNKPLFLWFFCIRLTEVAGEGGPDLAPQKFLSSQKFRYLMR